MLFDGSSRIANVSFSLLQTFVDLFSNYATDRRNKGGIDGLVQGIRTRVGNLGRNTTRFFIYVILELWLSDVACQKRSDVIAEIRRDNKRCVRFPRFHFLHGGITIGESPAKLIVVMQLINHLAAQIKIAHYVG